MPYKTKKKYRETWKRYYRRNKAYHKRRNKAWREKNREHVKKTQARWRLRNRAYDLERRKKWRRKNRKRSRAQSRKHMRLLRNYWGRLNIVGKKLAPFRVRQEQGRYGENLAIEWLSKNGYTDIRHISALWSKFPFDISAIAPNGKRVFVDATISCTKVVPKRKPALASVLGMDAFVLFLRPDGSFGLLLPLRAPSMCVPLKTIWSLPEPKRRVKMLK